MVSQQCCRPQDLSRRLRGSVPPERSGKPCLCLSLSLSQQRVLFPCTHTSLPAGGAVPLASVAHLLTVIFRQQCGELSRCTPPARNPEPSLCRCPASTHNSGGIQARAHTGRAGGVESFLPGLACALLVGLEGRRPEHAAAVGPQARLFLLQKIPNKGGAVVLCSVGFICSHSWGFG